MAKVEKISTREANAIYFSGQLILAGSGWRKLWEVMMCDSEKSDEAALYVSEQPDDNGRGKGRGRFQEPTCLGLYQDWQAACLEVVRLMKADHADRPEPQSREHESPL